VFDHLTGEIVFGDGLSGMIPPRGVGNVRMKRYQSGGGVRGNRQESAVVQLKTTVPYIEKVVNTEASAGGAEAETLNMLYERAPRMIRHRNRAVTVEDYADVAMLASPEVARARCVPLRKLAADALGGSLEPGAVSVIVVPRTRDPKPLPTLELISRVESYLRERIVPTAGVSVVGPLYLRVNVAAEIALVSLEGAGAVEQAVRDRLEAFLHPLTGGMDGKGWDFGREPYKSDFYALIEKVPGVDHIRSLTLTQREEPAGTKATGRFLVYSGSHAINLIFETA
jgi:predicted phage baseplate assembly protein